LWYQDVGGVSDALAMEKRVKRWRRPWKEKLISEMNPDRLDLSSEWYTHKDLEE
jgi:putative endonuclease